LEQISAPANLVLSTETPAKAVTNFRAMLVASGLIPLLLSAGYYLCCTPNWDTIAILVCSQLYSFSWGLVFVSGLWRGTWVFDEQGITFQPGRGQSKSLSWERVQRIRWEGIKALQGDGTTIRLLLLRFTKSERENAISFAESKLAARFDLKPRPPRPARPPIEIDFSDPRLRISIIAYGAVALGFFVVTAATALAPLGGTEFLLRVIRPLCLAILILGWPFMLMPVFWLALLYWADFKTRRRKGTAIPSRSFWRLPREETLFLAQKVHARKDFDDWSL
jgi:hypothetical protein